MKKWFTYFKKNMKILKIKGKKNNKHKLGTQDLSWCPVLKDALNLGSQSNLFLRTWSIQWWMCFSRLHLVSMGLDKAPPSSDFTLTRQSFKEICWFALDLFRDKEYLLREKAGISLFLNGIFSCSKFDKRMLNFEIRVL